MRHLLFCVALILTPCLALADKRLGLVIGIDSYTEVNDLQKARADASAVSDALRSQGFTVTTVLDPSRREMNKQISIFTSQLEPGDTAAVFYAGHGVEIDGENYLLPADIAAPQRGEKDFIKSESIALSALLDRIRATGARTTLAIIDACRDNPFAATTGRSIGGTRGLGRITAPEGTFVIFSAGAGQTALDRLSDSDPSANSVFTRMLLPRLQSPGVELREMMSGLRRDVRDLALTIGHEQFPAYYDELLGQFYFTPASAAAPANTVASSAAKPAPATPPASDTMRADFELARSLGTRAAYDAFINQYSTRRDAFIVQMALQLRDALPTADAPTKPTPTAPTPVQPAAQPAPVPAQSNSRDILRRTQAQLNALGCRAGTPDGVIGPRTRAAFARFLAETTTGLGADDLGTAHALAALNARSGTICPQVAATPRATAPAPRTATAAPAPAPAPVYSMVGSWNWSSRCPLGRANGTTTYRSAGGNSYVGESNSTVGYATVTGRLNGRSYTGTSDYGLIKNRSSGTLSADGRTLTMRVSNGCSVTARKN
ncbi:MAG: caspase family protein [Pseudomonadota bacterium]